MARSTKAMQVNSSKEALDAKIVRIVDIKAQRHALEKEEKALIKEVEAHYHKDASEAETVVGIIGRADKVPVDRSEYTVDIEAILPDAVVKKVDKKVVEQAIKDGIVTEAQANRYKVKSFTFKSIFSVVKDTILKVVR